MSRLTEKGIRCAFIDITKLGGRNVTPEQWYAGMALEIGRSTGLRKEILEYWKAEESIGPMQRFFAAIRQVLLGTTNDRFVIFVDEIDSTRSLPFNTDEFFAGVRECFNRRVQEEEFERLTFCFLGVAVPSDLIRDARTTPFNIGDRIYLKDFTLEEAMPLAAHLGPHGEEAIRRVHHWTNGHPYLTQSLCRALMQHPSPRASDVDAMVRRDLLEPKVRETNINLSDVGNRVLNGYADGEDVDSFRANILSAYQKAVTGREQLFDDESNRIAAVLKLSGLMRSEGRHLLVRNRIYERVFGKEWIAENMPEQEVRRQRRAFRTGAIRTALVSGAVVLAIGSLAAFALNQADRANRLARSLERSAQDLQTALDEQRVLTERAVVGEKTALLATERAEESARAARQEKARAEDLARQATAARANEAEARGNAETARRDADYRSSLLLVDRASQSLRTGDAAGALPDLVAALRADRNDPARQTIGRIRLDAALRSARTIKRVWKASNAVVHAAMLAGGSRVLLVDSSGVARVFSAATGQEVLPPMRFGEAISAASVSPDRRRLALGGNGGQVAIFDLTTGRQTGRARERGVVKVVRFSADGSLLAVGSTDSANISRLQVRSGLDASLDASWSTALKAALGDEVAAGGVWRTAAISPDGKHLICAFRNYIVVLVSREERRARAFTRQWDNRGVEFANGGRQVILGGYFGDNNVTHPAGRLFQIEGQLIRDIGGPEPVGAATSVVLSLDEGSVLMTRSNGNAGVYDLKTGRPIGPAVALNQATCGSLGSGGQVFATGSEDGVVRIWDAKTGQPIGTSVRHTARVLGVELSQDARSLLSWSSDGTVRLSATATGDSLALTYASTGLVGVSPMDQIGEPWSVPGEPIPYLIRNKKESFGWVVGCRLIVREDGMPHLYLGDVTLKYGIQRTPSGYVASRLRDGRRIGGVIPAEGDFRQSIVAAVSTRYAVLSTGPKELSFYTLLPKPTLRFRRSYEHVPHHLMIAEEGHVVGVNTSDGSLEVIDLRTGFTVIRERAIGNDSWVRMSFSRDGSRVMYFRQNQVVLADCSTGRAIATFGARIPVFSPDSKTVLLLGNDSYSEKSLLLDSKTGRVLASYPGQSAVQTIFKFRSTADERSFLLLGDTIGRYSWRSGKLIQRIPLPPTHKMEMSADGSRIVASDVSHNVRVFDLKRERMAPFVIRKNQLPEVRISGDGSLFSVQVGERIEVYDASSGEWVTSVHGIASNFVGRGTAMVWYARDPVTQEYTVRSTDFRGDSRGLDEIESIAGLIAGERADDIQRRMDSLRPVQTRRLRRGPDFLFAPTIEKPSEDPSK